MKLTVWIAEQNQDSSAYNIVTRTKREALAEMRARPSTEWEGPVKVTIEYQDAFDLFTRATGESGGRHAYY